VKEDRQGRRLEEEWDGMARQKTGEDVRGGWDGIARQKTGEEWDGRERKISIEGGGGARDLGRNIYAGGKGRSAGGPQVLKQRVPGAHLPTLVKRLLLICGVSSVDFLMMWNNHSKKQ